MVQIADVPLTLLRVVMCVRMQRRCPKACFNEMLHARNFVVSPVERLRNPVQPQTTPNTNGCSRADRLAADSALGDSYV